MVSGARECFNHAMQRFSATTINQLAEGLKMKGSCGDRSRSARFARGIDNHQGKLVSIVYMVPLKDLDGHKGQSSISVRTRWHRSWLLPARATLSCCTARAIANTTMPWSCATT